MADIHATPQGLDEVKGADNANKQKVFLGIIHKMLTEQILLHEISSGPVAESEDQVTMYARELLTLGLLLAEFVDAVKEGVGPRVIRIWKFLLPIFSSSKRSNYAIQSFSLLAKCQFLSSPRIQQQLTWSRFVNTRGVPGGNKEMDLHMEHLNCTVKFALSSQASNLKPKSIYRTGKIVGALDMVTQQFDEHTDISCQGDKHASVSYQKDIDKIVHQLHNKTAVFAYMSGRKHHSFSKLHGHITSSLCTQANYEKFMQWMNKQFFNLTH